MTAYSTTLLAAIVSAYESAISTSPKLRIYTGSIPASVGSAPTGTLLAELSLPSDYLGNPTTTNTSATVVNSTEWTGSAIASGTAGYYRVYDTSNVCYEQGSISSLSANTGDVLFDNPDFITSQIISFQTFSKTLNIPPVIPAGTIVVSASSFGGIPTGNDTSGTGTISSPYATLAKALTVVAEGGSIVLNGNPSNPSIYQAATFYSITKGISIDSVYPYGATLRGTGAQTRVVNLAPTAGQTITLGKIAIDATNSIGSCVLVGDVATAFTVNATGTKFTNWTTQGFAGAASATATKVKATLDSCQFVADNTRSALYFIGMIEGYVNLRNSTLTITNQNLSGHGGMFVRAKASGVQMSSVGNTFNISLDSGTSGTTFGVQASNIVGANISNNSFTVTGPSNGRSVEVVQIVATSAAPLDTTAATVKYNVINHNANGGMCIEIGEDNQDSGSRSYQNGAVVEGNTLFCNSVSQAGVTHGLFNGSGANTIFKTNFVKMAGIGIGDKEGSGAIYYSNVFVDCGNSYLRVKGANSGKYIHNTFIKTSNGPGTLILVSNNQTNGHSGTGNLVTGNIFYSTVNTTMLNDAGTEGITYGYNDYYSTAGLATNPWAVGATNYATLSAWQAIESSAIAVNPTFINAANDNYDITTSTTGLNIVPADAAILTDFLGRNYASPATVGAYQKQ